MDASVFVSYSHADEPWKDRLLRHLGGLRDAGRISIWDDRRIDPGGAWYEAITQAMDGARVAICLISERFLASDFCAREEIPHLLRRREEGGLVLIPVLLRPCAWRAVWWVRPIQMLPRDGRSLEGDYNGRESEILDELSQYVAHVLEDPAFRRPAAVPAGRRVPEKVDTSRLPITDAALFGRERELTLLTHAWHSHDTHVVSFVGWGGVGKSTLVNKWLERVTEDGYLGARRVYAWSFFSQGTSDRATSADEFVADALAWIDDPDPAAGSAWSKGERLAALVQQQKTLLLLDGIEPLQAPFEVDHGRIRDPALATLVGELARHNSGLCVITTRVPVGDLDLFPETTAQENLERISTAAGRSLLRVCRVHGSDAQLDEAVRAFGGHALAVHLIGRFLRRVPGHPIGAALEVPDLDLHEDRGRHPRRVMAAFAARFGDGPEVRLLRLLGLFDRPASLRAVAAVAEGPPIGALTRGLPAGGTQDWFDLIEALRDAGLLARRNERQPDMLDAHPLVREHFGEDLRAVAPDAWREGHSRLYDHLTAAVRPRPDTIEEMSVLFDAMGHGCHAGRHAEVLKRVYQDRVLQDFNYISTDRLGAYGAGLGALAGFFDVPPHQVVGSLTRAEQAYVLHETAVHLLGGGRLGETFTPFQRAVELYEAEGMWEWASTSARYLAEGHVLSGSLGEALRWADRSVACADRADDRFEMMADRVTRGDVLHQSGRFEEAEAAFLDAEQVRDKEGQPIPNLFFFWGFGYGELLLTRGRHAEAETRARRALALIGDTQGSLLAAAQIHLSLGTALVADPARQAGEAVEDHLGRALDYLRHATHQVHLPRGLLARAALSRLRGQPERARADVDEVLRIATRSGMRLYEADAQLALARLFLAGGDTYRARLSVERARQMVAAMGYWRRAAEVTALERAVGESLAE
ncbi:MAG: TIR domain-containing protein [Vicinamibacterales bacterium]